jgi:glycosyltransferase involved in cell wall biosynthesis
MADEKLYIIIPAYNEEDNIEMVAREWYEVVQSISTDARLVIINDGSKDATYEKLLALQKEMPQLEPLTKENSGHGATLLYGYRYALEQGADYIFQTDSDGQTLPAEFTPFWDKRHEYDALIGYRNQRQDGLSRVFVSRVLKLVLRLIFGVNVTDANTPFRLMKRELLEKYIESVPKDFNLSNVMFTVLFFKYNEKVQFIPITFRPRQGGVNSINLVKITQIGVQAVKDFRVIKRSL